MSSSALRTNGARVHRFAPPLFAVAAVILMGLAAVFFPTSKSEAATGGNASGVYDIEITNLTNGIYFTPLLVTAHADTASLFSVGTAASTELQAMAEGGDISGLVTAVGDADDDTIDNPAAGLLAPGGSTTAQIDCSQSGNDRLSIVAMLLPTNDGFVGLDSLRLPSEPGTYTYFLYAYDAGTEANDELMNTATGGTPGVPGIPADPGGMAATGGTGVTTAEANTNVHIHRGVVGDVNADGTSDLVADVHRWLNPVARVTITAQ